MIVDLMREILSDYRDNISLEKMDEILCGNSLQNKIFQTLNDTDEFTLSNGCSIKKSTLVKHKSCFFEEFDEYLKDKIYNGKIRADIINNFKQKIPDVISSQWVDISMERQLYVFDLLIAFIVKPSKFVDPIKSCFNHIIDLYSSIAIYLTLLFKNYEDDVDVLCGIFEQIDDIESHLSEFLFNLLTKPELERENLPIIENQIELLDKQFENCIEKYFTQIFKNSRHLFKRVFDAELNKFDLTVILTRYNFKSLNDWVLFLVDNDNQPTERAHDLFKDLEVY